MACSSPSSCAPSDFDLQLAARSGLQSLHSFISLCAAPAASTSFSSLQQQQRQSMAAAETIIKFKHLRNLMSQCKGHARVREAPRVAAGARADDNPAMPSSACEHSRFSHMGLSASNGTGSTGLEDRDSGGFYEEGKSVRGDSHIDLNHRIDSSADYEGSINEFSWRGYNNTEDMIKGCDYPSIAKDYGNIKHKPDNYGFFSMIDDANPSSLDLNQEAPSLDSSSSLTSPVTNFMLPSTAKQTMPPLFCPNPTVAFLPPSQESFSFDGHTKSAPFLHSQATPSASNTTSTSMEDDFTKLAHNPHQKSTLFYEGQDEGSLTGQLPQIFSVNSHAHVEKAACLIPTPTYSLPSYISLEGNLSTKGNVPVFQQPQPDTASKASSEGTKRKCPSISDNSNLTKCGNNPSKCRCARRRKLKNKSIIRVPAISEKAAEIPQDDYSWRKYGQKPIKGSPFPRGYYKCSGVKGCPAKKHVERALDDPAMLIVTYEGEHIHSRLVLEEPSQI